MENKVPIKIPDRLKQKIDAGSTYTSPINNLIGKLSATIGDKADFFPEYTLHGWGHVQTVLNYADKLIPQETFDTLTDRDIAMLVCAVVLHDLGMFINKEGVKNLLTKGRRSYKTQYLDEQDWESEWKQYIQEIGRFPEEKRLYHFGTAGTIKEPDLSKDVYSSLETLVIGEFLRRHHHRIAHEIALDTMPGDTDLDVLFVGIDSSKKAIFDRRDRMWIGILARSHGMSIQKTHEYTERIPGGGQQHLTYLMAVLRIADALDIGEGRVPNSERKLRGVHTPISVQEWTWNERITETDPEWEEIKDGRFISANPQSTTEFVYLEKQLHAIQQELNFCWALLLELQDYQRYRLSIHRIDSDILKEDKRENFADNFVINEARLKADSELLKLLVEPLYESDPSCGVRELIQNAVDACIERAQHRENNYRGKVTVSLVTNEGKKTMQGDRSEKDDKWFGTLTVTDNGVGMDENVILNYYLSAGASYRNSEEWLSIYATGRDPNIIRNGRFGVGVLATFLLGDKVKVKTWPLDADKGYAFEFGLEPKSLDIKRVGKEEWGLVDDESVPEGTTITVELKEDALKKLLEDYRNEGAEQTWLNWYRFTDPSVEYWVDGEKYTVPFSPVPQHEESRIGWYELPGTEFEQALWGYPHDGFFCNGIRIPWGIYKYYRCEDITIDAPSISVIDKNEKLKVDIARRFLKGFPEAAKKHLKQEVVRYAIAELLMADWGSNAAFAERLVNGIPIIKQADHVTPAPLIHGDAAYTLLHAPFAKKNLQGIRDRLLVFHIKKDTSPDALVTWLRTLNLKLPFVIHPERFDTNDPDALKNVLAAVNKPSSGDLYYGMQCLRLYVGNDLNRGNVNWIWHDSIVGEKLTKYKYIKKEKYTPHFMEEKWDSNICPVATEVYFGSTMHFGKAASDETENGLWKFVDTYMRVKTKKGDERGYPWIPYDMQERQKLFPEAFNVLKPYIDQIIAAREFRSVKLYEGGAMPSETDEFYRQKSPYKTLNLLMMAGREGERIRVCVEGQKPNGLFIRRWEDTLQALTDIFTVCCRCAKHHSDKGKLPPYPLSRGDRGVNFRLMEASGGTFAFTSTTNGEVLDSFVAGKQEPHALHMTIADGVPYLDMAEFLGKDYHYTDQREILLPPMAKMEHGPCHIVEHDGIGPVCHYSIRFTGMNLDFERQNEKNLTGILQELCSAAADGLDNLAAQQENAAVFQDDNHPYWQWKTAFRQLVMQRMADIYQAFYP